MSVLLKEYNQLVLKEEQVKELNIANKEGKPLTVIGVIQRADAKNANGRVYPYNILKKEVDRYKDEVVNKGVGLGQLDHIDSPVIELKDVSHIIDDVWWGSEKPEITLTMKESVGDPAKTLFGKIRILNTPRGQIAKEIVIQNIPLGISSRAVGSVKKVRKEGLGEVDEVGDDLQMIAWDLVAQPSTEKAYLSLHEAKEIKNFNPSKVLPTEIRITETLKDLLKK